MKRNLIVLLIMILLCFEHVSAHRNRLRLKSRSKLKKKELILTVITAAFVVSYIVSTALKLYSAYILHKVNQERFKFIDKIDEVNTFIEDMQALHCIGSMNRDLTNTQLIAGSLSNHAINDHTLRSLIKENKCDCGKFKNEYAAIAQNSFFEDLDPNTPQLRRFLDSFSISKLEQKEDEAFDKKVNMQEEAECLRKFKEEGEIDQNDSKCLRFKHLLHKTATKKRNLVSLLNPDTLFGKAHQRIKQTQSLITNISAKGEELLYLAKDTDFMGLPIEEQTKENINEFLEDVTQILHGVTEKTQNAVETVKKLLCKVQKFVNTQIKERLQNLIKFAEDAQKAEYSVDLSDFNLLLKKAAAELIMFAKEKAEAVEVEVDFSLPSLKKVKGAFETENIKGFFTKNKNDLSHKIKGILSKDGLEQGKSKVKQFLIQEINSFRAATSAKISNWSGNMMVLNREFVDLTLNEIGINVYQLFKKKILKIDLNAVLKGIKAGKDPKEIEPSKNLAEIKEDDENNTHSRHKEEKHSEHNHSGEEENKEKNRKAVLNQMVHGRNHSSNSTFKFREDSLFHSLVRSKGFKELRKQVLENLIVIANRQISKFKLSLSKFDLNSLHLAVQAANPELKLDKEGEIEFSSNMTEEDFEFQFSLFQATVLTDIRKILAENQSIQVKKLCSKVKNKIAREFSMDSLTFDSNLALMVDEIEAEVDLTAEDPSKLLNKVQSTIFDYTKREFEDLKNNFSINPYLILKNIENKAVNQTVSVFEDELNKKYSLGDAINAAKAFGKTFGIESVKDIKTFNIKAFLKAIWKQIKKRLTQSFTSIKSQLTVENAKQLGKSAMRQIVGIVKQKAKERVSNAIISSLNGHIEGLNLKELNAESAKSAVKTYVVNLIKTEKDKYISNLKENALEMLKNGEGEEFDFSGAAVKFLEFNESYASSLGDKFEEGVSKSVSGILEDIKEGVSPENLKKIIEEDLVGTIKGKIGEFVDKPADFIKSVNIKDKLLKFAGFKFKEVSHNSCRRVCGIKKQLDSAEKTVYEGSERLMKISRDMLKKGCTSYDYGKSEMFEEMVQGVSRRIKETQKEIFDEVFKNVFMTVQVLNSTLLQRINKVVTVTTTSKTPKTAEEKKNEYDKLKFKETRNMFETFRYMYMELETMEEEHKNDGMVKKLEQFRSGVKGLLDIADTFVGNDPGPVGVVISMSSMFLSSLEVGGYLISYIKQARKPNNQIRAEFAWETFISKAKGFVLSVKSGILKKIFAPIVIAMELSGAVNKVRKAIVFGRNEKRQIIQGEMALNQKVTFFAKNMEFETCKANLATLDFVGNVYDPIRKMSASLRESTQKMTAKQNSLGESPDKPVQITNSSSEIKLNETLKEPLLAHKSGLAGCIYNLSTCLMNQHDTATMFRLQDEAKLYLKRFFTFGTFSHIMVVMSYTQYSALKKQGFEVITALHRNKTHLEYAENNEESDPDFKLLSGKLFKDEKLNKFFVVMGCKCSTLVYVEKLHIYHKNRENAYIAFKEERARANLEETDTLRIHMVNLGEKTLVYSTEQADSKKSEKYAFHRYFNKQSVHAFFNDISVKWSSLAGSKHSVSPINWKTVEDFDLKEMNQDTERNSLLLRETWGKTMRFYVFDTNCLYKLNKEGVELTELKLEDERKYIVASYDKGTIYFTWVLSERLDLKCDSRYKFNKFINLGFDNQLRHSKVNGEDTDKRGIFTFDEGDTFDRDFESIYIDKRQKGLYRRMETKFDDQIDENASKKKVLLGFYLNREIEMNQDGKPDFTSFDRYETELLFFKKFEIIKQSQLEMKSDLKAKLQGKVCNLEINPCNYQDKVASLEVKTGVIQRSKQSKKDIFHLKSLKDHSKVNLFQKTNWLVESKNEGKEHKNRVDEELEKIRKETKLFESQDLKEKLIAAYFEFSVLLLPLREENRFIFQNMAHIQGFSGITDNFSSPECRDAVKELFSKFADSLNESNKQLSALKTGFHSVTKKMTDAQLEKVKISEVLNILDMRQVETSKTPDKYKTVGKECKFFNFSLAFQAETSFSDFVAVPKMKRQAGEVGKPSQGYVELSFEEGDADIGMFPTLWVDIGFYAKHQEKGNQFMHKNVIEANKTGYDILNNPVDNELTGSNYAFNSDATIKINFFGKIKRILPVDYSEVCSEEAKTK